MQVLSQLFNPLDQLEELKSENAAVRSFLDQAAGNFVIFQFFLITTIFAYFDILLQIKGRKWKIDDVDVCFNGFCKFLGMNPRTVLRMAHGLCDLRRMKTATTWPSLQRSVCSLLHGVLHVCSRAATRS